MPTTAQRPPANPPQTLSADGAATKGDLTTWWRQFKKGARKPKEDDQLAQPLQPVGGIFGVPLDISIKYANVAISQIDDNGQSYLYGYVPIIVAKCGVFLKEKAMDVEGIFRLAGAERRIKELMAVFNSPERYGRGLDWTGYTVHDAANLLRRYLNQLPEPIIPLAMYPRFRDPLRNHQAQAVGPMDQQLETLGDFDTDATIRIFQQLITELPPLNRQLLLYILDLLAVFASKCEINLMTAPNLSAIFQPGILRHPDHDLVPSEYRLSQDVVIFLIEHQDHFVIGLAGTAADEKTIKDVQTAPKPTTPTTPRNRTQQLLGRSASTASAGSDNVRKYGNVERHASTNSRGSRQSQHTPSPITTPAGSPLIPGSKGSGVRRSNTVPSKASPSPALSAQERFSRFHAAEPLAVAEVSNPIAQSPIAAVSKQPAASIAHEPLAVHDGSTPAGAYTPSPQRSPLLKPFQNHRGRSTSQGRRLSGEDSLSPNVIAGKERAGTPSRERNFSSLWKQSPSSDSERRDGRPRNRLQKKRPPGEMNAQDSQQSLSTDESNTVNPNSPGIPATIIPVQQQPALSEDLHDEQQTRPDMSTMNSFRTAMEQPGSPPQPYEPPTLERDASESTLKPAQTLKDLPQQHSGNTLQPTRVSPPGSITSGAEASSLSTGEEGEEGDGQEGEQREKKHHRWRISMSAKKNDEKNAAQGTPVQTIGSSKDAERSTSSVASNKGMRWSYAGEPAQMMNARAPSSSEGVDDRATSPRRGPIGWFRGKIQERQERKEGKERAKSPSLRGAASDQAASVQSLGAIASGNAVESSYQQQQSSAQTTVQAPTQELQDLSVSAANPGHALQTPPAQTPGQGLGLLSTDGAGDIEEAEPVTPKAPVQPMSLGADSQTASAVEDVEKKDDGH